MDPLHYLKLLPFLKPYAISAGANDESWAAELFGDLTHQGARLDLVPLQPNDTGPRVAIVGTNFVAEAGLDRDRDDTFFVSRVEARAQRSIEGTPKTVSAKLDRLVAGKNPHRDPVDRYFDGTRPRGEERTESPLHVDPSPRLSKVLRNAPAQVRERCRPQEVSASPTEALDAFRWAWRKHRLEQFGPGGVQRSVMVLNGTVAPGALSPEDELMLQGVFNVGMLNRIAFGKSERPVELYPILEDFVRLPIAPEVRAALWAGMLLGLNSSDLQRELHEAADALAEVARSPDGQGFAEALLGELAKVASAPSGGSIRALLELAKTDEQPLNTIAEWARRLEIQRAGSTEAKETRPASEPPPRAQSPSQPQAEPLALTPASALEDVGRVSSMVSGSRVKPEFHHRPRGFDTWVLSLRGVSVQDLERRRASVRSELQSVVDLLQEPLTVAAMKRTSAELERLAEVSAQWAQAMPSSSALAEDERESQAALDELVNLAPLEVEALLAGRPQPSQLVEVARLLHHREVLEALPEWVWTPSECLPENIQPLAAGELSLQLLDPIVARRAKLVTQLMSELSLELGAIQGSPLERPAPDTSIDEHLELMFRSSAEQRRLLQDLRGEYRSWVEAALQTGGSFKAVATVVRLLEQLRGILAQEVFASILKLVEDAAGLSIRQELAAAYLAAVSKYERKRGRPASQASLDALELLLEDHGDVEQGSQVRFSMDHNYTGSLGERARLNFVKAEGAPYGRIQAPLVLQTSVRADAAVSLNYEVLSPSAASWPSDWERPSPIEMTVHRSDWREHPERGDRFVFSFMITVPVRSPRRPGEALLRVRLSASTAEGSTERTLEWPQLALERIELALNWPDSLNPEFVRAHPIGPQKEADRIADRMTAGSSFAVIAPRRFGKSTLIEHLREMDGRDGLLVLPPIVCTQYVRGPGVDADLLWGTVSSHFEEAVGAPLSLNLEGGLPRAGAFQAAKAMARHRGYRIVVILFDEAQAMFSRGAAGHQLGDRLKDAIEFHWSKSSTTEASVVFGLVGLPGLRDRAGANLMDKLRPFDDRDIEESDLNKLILKVTSGNLQTTREARLRIASLSHNLAIAREIVERLLDRARRDQRSWLNYDDVRFVEEDLKVKLRAGRELFVSSLRDVFNTAESVNEWRPSEQFPVAVALAEARAEGLRVEDELCKRATERLNAWAAEAEDDSLQRLVYTSERVIDHIKALRETGILERSAFRSPLIEAWLVGQGRSDPNATEPFRTAMLAAAVRRVRRPAALEPVSEGGQARVYRFSIDDDVLAYREAFLGTHDERLRFSDNLSTLRELTKRLRDRDSGSEYVFDLRAVGLRDDDDRYAVQIYRWIDGFDLDAWVGQLKASAVAQLGHDLACGLAWLHRSGIIHRDLRPRNIVWRAENARPLMIDFGLAKLVGSRMNTEVASEFAAPEVRTSTPQWSKASDVWSLATTLQKLLAPSEANTKVAEVLGRASGLRPDTRPSADTLHDELSREAARLRTTEASRQLFEQHVREVAQEDAGSTFYSGLLQKFQPRFEAVFAGLQPTVISRAMEAADFLNQVLEAWKPGGKGDKSYSLGEAKNSSSITREEFRVLDFLHKLRMTRSHGTGQPTAALERFSHLDDQKIAAMAIEGARYVGKTVGLQSLEAVVRAFFS